MALTKDELLRRIEALEARVGVLDGGGADQHEGPNVNDGRTHGRTTTQRDQTKESK